MQNKTRQSLIADSLVIFVFDITDSYFLPGHIYTFSRGCAWQFITIALASANTPLVTQRFVDSMAALAGGGVFQNFTGLYTVPFTSHPFPSIWRSIRHFDVYDLSLKAMPFARIIWGKKVACVRDRLSPSKFLDLNIFHRNSGRLHGHDLQ